MLSKIKQKRIIIALLTLFVLLSLAACGQGNENEKSDDNGNTEGYANAIVDKEHCVLVTTTVVEDDYPPMSPVIGKFHGSDIPFYYDSIKQNIIDRIAALK